MFRQVPGDVDDAFWDNLDACPSLSEAMGRLLNPPPPTTTVLDEATFDRLFPNVGSPRTEG